MPRYTPGMLDGWLREIAARIGSDVLRPLAKQVNQRVGARSTTRYMREGRGERGPNRTPVLRRMTGQLARSLTQLQGREAINRADIRGTQMTVTKGTTTPYAAAHEHGYSGTQQVPAHMRGGHPVRAHSRQMTIPARPFLQPAMEDELPGIRDRARTLLQTLIRRVVGSAPAGGAA